MLCFFVVSFFFFFFNDTATTEIYTLSLHDALPSRTWRPSQLDGRAPLPDADVRSEEHTSELQSPDQIVCRLLLEKKKKKNNAQLIKIKKKKKKTQQNKINTK